MRKYITAIFIFAIMSVSAFGQVAEMQKVEVGDSPVGVIWDESIGAFHVFCGGIDANFDGIIDETDDTAPSWWIVTPLPGIQGTTFEAKKVRDFENYFSFPFRPAIIPMIQSIIIPFSSTVKEFDMTNYEIVNDNLYSETDSDTLITAVSPSGPTHIFVSKRPPFAEGGKGLVEVVNRQSAMPIDFIQAGENVGQTLAISYTNEAGNNALGMSVINEGIFGMENSTFQFSEVAHMQATILDSFPIGDTGNFMAYDFLKQEMIIASHGSSQLHFFNPSAEEITRTIDLNESNPREFKIFNGFIYATTYTNKIQKINYETGSIQEYDLDAFSEGIDANQDGIFAVATPFDANFSALNTITVFTETISSVNENDEVSTNLYPNPARNNINIESSNVINRIRILDITGTILLEERNFDNSISINNLNLPNGSYFVEITTDFETKVMPLIISK